MFGAVLASYIVDIARPGLSGHTRHNTKSSTNPEGVDTEGANWIIVSFKVLGHMLDHKLHLLFQMIKKALGALASPCSYKPDIWPKRGLLACPGGCVEGTAGLVTLWDGRLRLPSVNVGILAPRILDSSGYSNPVHGAN